MRVSMLVALVCLVAAPAMAADGALDVGRACAAAVVHGDRIEFSWNAVDQPRAVALRFPSVRFDVATACADRPFEWRRTAAGAPAATDPAAQTARVRAFEYSDGYHTRARIHKLASFATLPLFGIEAWLGQRLFNNVALAGGSTRSAHKYIGEAIGGLFVVNTVTGIPNLLEARHDPNVGVRPIVHGVLMLVADCGFLATAILRPNSRTSAGLAVYDPKKNQHLTIAYASISVATVGYLIMLFK
jgi:hypothetical protein